MANHYFDSVINTNGRAVRGAVIYVRLEGGGYATIYSDDGVTPIVQASSPLTTDARGFFEFWTDETSVELEILYGGRPQKTIVDVPTLGEGFVDDFDGVKDGFEADSKRYPEQYYIASDGVDYAPATRRLIEDCKLKGKSPALRAGKVYRFNSTVIDPYALQWIAEPGCLILNGSTNSPALQLGTTGARTYKGSISGTITFASAVVGVSGQCGLRAFNTGQNDFGRILAVSYSPYLPLYDGVIFRDVAQFTYAVEVENCLHDGVILDKVVDPRCVSGRSDANGNNGWTYKATEGACLTGLSGYGNGGHGHHWAISADGINKNNFLTSMIGDTSGGDNIFIEDLWDTELVTCWGSGHSGATSPTAAGIRIRGSRAKALKFTGGDVLDNNGDGFKVEVETDSGAVNFGSPVGIRLYDVDYGSTAAAANGNGQSGTGYGLHLGPNLIAGAVERKGGRFGGNASGDVLNESAANALISDAWESGFTPTVTAATGTITSKSATCEYRREGDLVHIEIQVSITTNGTGAGTVNVTLPFQAAGKRYILGGYEAAATGRALTGYIDGGSQAVNIRDSTGYPGVDGAVLIVNGFYRAVPV